MTERLPFDPSKMKGTRKPAPKSEPAGAKASDASVTVSQLAAMIGQAVSGAFPQSVRVVGEISNFSNRTHWYFAIKDAGATVNCVMFAGRTRGAAFMPENGQQVVLTGRVEVYEPQGKLTLNAEKLEPVGAGALELAYRKLLAEIRELGWFDAGRKRALPIFPRKIAVVTSAKGAALQDVLNTLKKRCPAVEVVLVDVLVQGASAAGEVARAIDWLSVERGRLAIEAVLVTRGGGSMEDLWAFNEKVVAEAIVRCAVPVVAAIGHETDTTIAELVADERCATPTQAAMRLSPDRAALMQQSLTQHRRMELAVQRMERRSRDKLREAARGLFAETRNRLSERAVAFSKLGTRLERLKPTAVHQRRFATFAVLVQRIETAMSAKLNACRETERTLAAELLGSQKKVLQNARTYLASAARQLDLVGPVAVLRRGYSVTLDARGRVVRGPGDVKVGERMVTRLAEGEIESTVGRSAVAPIPSGRKRKKQIDDGSGGLFEQP